MKWRSLLHTYPARSIFLASSVGFIILQLLTINPEQQQRFIFFTLSMWQQGMTFFPYVDQQPYADYLSLPTVFSYACSCLVGHVSVFSVGLPYCLASAAIVAWTYRLGSLYQPRVGWLSVGFVLLTWKFLDGVSAYDLDLFPALAALISIYYAMQQAARGQSTPVSAFLWCVFNACWLFGFFTRGPVGLIVPAMTLGIYYFSGQRWRVLIYLIVNSVLLLLLLTAMLAYAAYHVGGERFLTAVLGQEGLGRLFSVPVRSGFRKY